MARRPQQCSLLLLATALLATATVVVADDEKCGSPCGNPCGVPCGVYYASPPPPPDYYPPPPPPEYYPPPTTETPTTTDCPPPPSGGGYEPTPGYTPTPGGYNPTPSSSGWWSPPYTPTYNTPPGMLYPRDPGFRANDAAGRRSAACWRAVLLVAASTCLAGVLAL